MSRGTRYTVALLAVLLLLLGSVALFNAAVDPYDRYRLVNIEGFNAYKPEASHGLRLYKSLAVRRIEPAAIILGSSRSNIGLRTTHPGWDDEEPRYNLSVDSAAPVEMLALLRHAQAVHPLRQVVVGLEFDSFDIHRGPTADFDPALLRDPDRIGPDIDLFSIDFRLLLSRSALGASLRTLSRQHGSVYSGLENRGSELAGLRALTANLPRLLYSRDQLRDNARPATAEYAADGQENGEHSFRSLAADKFHGDEAALFLASEQKLMAHLASIARDFSLGPPDDTTTPLGRLRAMIAFCRAHDIRLYLYIHPGQGYAQAAISQAGLWPQYEDWKRRLVAILADDASRHADAAPFPLWDFSLFSTVTDEAPPTPQDPQPRRNFWDVVHYKQAIGDWMLDRMFGVRDAAHPVPADFGVHLDATTLEAVLAADRGAEDRWQQHHATALAKTQAAARTP